MSEQPITFERDGRGKVLLTGYERPFTNRETGETVQGVFYDGYATDADLRAAGYVRVPSVEDLDAIIADAMNVWAKVPSEHIARAVLQFLTGGDER